MNFEELKLDEKVSEWFVKDTACWNEDGNGSFLLMVARLVSAKSLANAHLRVACENDVKVKDLVKTLEVVFNKFIDEGTMLVHEKKDSEDVSNDFS